MEFRCKLSAVNDIVFKLWYEIKEPLRSYEVHPTEESLGWGRSSVCEYDYTVHIPALKLFFVMQRSLSLTKKNRRKCR